MQGRRRDLIVQAEGRRSAYVVGICKDEDCRRGAKLEKEIKECIEN